MSSLNERVLVLNSRWQPVTAINVAKAFVLLYRGAARAIDVLDDYKTYDFEGWVGLSANKKPSSTQVRTPTLRLDRPEIVILTRFGGHVKRRVSLNLDTVALRDNYFCGYCNKNLMGEPKSIDHIIPRSRKSSPGTTWANVVLCCLRCNNFKANRLPHEAGMKLRVTPRYPEWQFDYVTNAPESWKQFLKDEEK